MQNIVVSIIIPVYRDWNRLSKCLENLENQTYPQEKFEILIVNNDFSDDNYKTIKMPKNATLLIESKAGSYAARNTGIKNSRGKILGFTDSDCIPDKYWIQNAVEIFDKNPNIKRIGGNIKLFYKSSRPNIYELYEKIYAFKQEEKCENGYSVTANLFTYKYVIEEVGGFNEKLLSGGDWEWGKRTEKLNFKIIFGNHVIVNHPARNSLKELIQKTKRVSGGQLNAIKQTGFIPKIPGINYMKKYGQGERLNKKILIMLIRIFLKLIALKEIIYIILLGKKAERQ